LKRCIRENPANLTGREPFLNRPLEPSSARWTA
jgi:hypothetical protein